MATVCKYMSASRFAEHMDEYLEGKLYFAKWWDELNDPKEGKYLAGTMACDSDAKDVLRNMKYEVRVCSATENDVENMRLWEMYAQNHSGVCMVINTDDSLCTKCQNEDTLTNEHMIFHPVDYNSGLLRVHDISHNPKKAAIDILMRKLNSWKQEREMRFLGLADNDGIRKNGMAKIGEVAEIIFGPNFTDLATYTRLRKKLRNSRNSNSNEIRNIKLKSARFPGVVVDDFDLNGCDVILGGT